MIRLGLRLTFAGGREALVRLVVIAAAVALGSGLLLAVLAGINGVNVQRGRYAWLATGSGLASAPNAAGHDPIWWRLSADQVGGTIIDRVDIAATGPSSPVPPGIPRLPGPGQYYASPALARLLRATPADQLAGRFPGHQIGIIGASALPSPGSLIIVVGHAPGQIAHVLGTTKAASIPSRPEPINCYGCAIGLNANGVDLTLAVVAGALLLPVLIFVAAATRLSAARREQRFAAMRLAGATPRQISVISAVESAVAAVAGVAAGFGLFYALRVPLAAIPFTGQSFYPGDLSLGLADIVLVGLGVPAAAAIAARVALRRVRISALGVSRRVTPPAPRAWRVIPLLAGVAELAVVTGIGRLHSSGSQIAEFLPGFMLITIGLVIAGPWLTMAGARLLASRTSRPAALISARRLADNPSAGFRAISGLVVALFIITVAAAVITAMSNDAGAAGATAAADSTILDEFSAGQPGYTGSVHSPPPAVLAELRAIHGVSGVAVIYANPTRVSVPIAALGRRQTFGLDSTGLVTCTQLARIPALGRCGNGAAVAIIPSFVNARQFNASVFTWPSPPAVPARLRHLPVKAIAVSTDGSAAAIGRAQTSLEQAYPYEVPPATISGLDSADPASKDLAGYEQLADVVIIASLIVAGCTLAASAVGGLADRKRPFSLLRLAGAPLGMLRRVVIVESAVPLLFVAVVAVGLGFAGAALFLHTQLHFSLRSPDASFYALLIAGLAGSLGVIAATFPLLGRITGAETARNE